MQKKVHDLAVECYEDESIVGIRQYLDGENAIDVTSEQIDQLIEWLFEAKEEIEQYEQMMKEAKMIN